jgi:exodeoxyribonuclease VII small subunit
MAQKKQTFEAALSDLEEVVSKLQAGKLTLDEALAAYEKGMGLVRFCNERLADAEKRIEAVCPNENGFTTEKFDEVEA